MTPLTLNYGPDVIVKGLLFNTMEPSFLSEDMLEIDLPSGATIAVGWDENRRVFDMVIFDGDWDNRLASGSANTVPEVLTLLTWAVNRYRHSLNQPVISASSDDCFDVIDPPYTWEISFVSEGMRYEDPADLMVAC